MAEKEMKVGGQGLQTLKVWQRVVSFAEDVCKDVLPSFPQDERWALTSQLRRSVQSVPANIAEGYGRYYYQDGIRYCYIARGSLEESFSHLVLAQRLGYISAETYSALEREINEIRQMINGYIRFLKQSKRGANDPGSNHSVGEIADYYTPEKRFDGDIENDDLIT